MRLAVILSLAFLPLAIGLRAGELRTDEIQSKFIDRTVKLNVLLPDGYEAAGERRFPVIYLLHGIGGDYTEWKRVGVEAEATGLPVIIAMPEGDQSFYVNHHGVEKARWEDYITKEVIPHVDGRYRTVARREARGISGLSMGGYGAVALGFRHPELFASVASHSGAVAAARMKGSDAIGKRLEEAFGPEDSPARAAYDPLRLIAELPKERRPHLYIDCGSGDFLLESNRELVRELAKLRVDYEYRELPGRHDFAYWKANVRYSLSRQLEALAKAAVAPSPKDEKESPAAAPSIAGVWLSKATLPDGRTRDATLTLETRDGKVTGRSQSDQGTIELSRVTFADRALVLEVDIERDGRKGVVRVDARLGAEGKLAGRWSLLDDAGTEFGSGDWVAEKEKKTTTARADDKKAAPAGAGGVAGDWKMLVTFNEDTEFDYTLRIRKAGDGLEAVLVSPRSGEHKFKSAAFKDGTLKLEIEREIEGMNVEFQYEAKLGASGLSGTVVPKGFENEFKGTWKAERLPAEGGDKPAPVPEKL